jgi:hypothetical protein
MTDNPEYDKWACSLITPDVSRGCTDLSGFHGEGMHNWREDQQRRLKASRN